MTQPTAAVAKLVDKANNPQIGDRQASVTVTAVQTVNSANSVYSAIEVGMLNNLRTDVENLRATMVELVDKLEAHGLIADN